MDATSLDVPVTGAADTGMSARALPRAVRSVLVMIGLTAGLWLLGMLLHAATAGAATTDPDQHPVSALVHRVTDTATTLAHSGGQSLPETQQHAPADVAVPQPEHHDGKGQVGSPTRSTHDRPVRSSRHERSEAPHVRTRVATKTIKALEAPVKTTIKPAVTATVRVIKPVATTITTTIKPAVTATVRVIKPVATTITTTIKPIADAATVRVIKPVTNTITTTIKPLADAAGSTIGQVVGRGGWITRPIVETPTVPSALPGVELVANPNAGELPVAAARQTSKDSDDVGRSVAVAGPLPVLADRAEHRSALDRVAGAIGDGAVVRPPALPSPDREPLPTPTPIAPTGGSTVASVHLHHLESAITTSGGRSLPTSDFFVRGGNATLFDLDQARPGFSPD